MEDDIPIQTFRPGTSHCPWHLPIFFLQLPSPPHLLPSLFLLPVTVLPDTSKLTVHIVHPHPSASFTHISLHPAICSLYSLPVGRSGLCKVKHDLSLLPESFRLAPFVLSFQDFTGSCRHLQPRLATWVLFRCHPLAQGLLY